MQKQNFAISCDDEEERVLSNWRDLETWDALEKLLRILMGDASSNILSVLYAWKTNPHHHQAAAKEPYSWRGALEEIKNADLSAACADWLDRNEASLMADKPTMLKIAGEITNSLMHSYEARHKISFIQRVSNVPL